MSHKNDYLYCIIYIIYFAGFNESREFTKDIEFLKVLTKYEIPFCYYFFIQSNTPSIKQILIVLNENVFNSFFVSFFNTIPTENNTCKHLIIEKTRNIKLSYLVTNNYTTVYNQINDSLKIKMYFVSKNLIYKVKNSYNKTWLKKCLQNPFKDY